MASKFGENLKWFVVGAAETVKDSAKKAVNDVKEVKLPEIKVPDIKIPDVKDVFKKKEEDVYLSAEEAISTNNALTVIYYLMAADGGISPDEKEKFDLIGAELDPGFEEDKASIVAECGKVIAAANSGGEYLDSILDEVEKALTFSVRTVDSFITPKLLLWDLLTVAYSDHNYDDNEKDFIKYVVRRLKIDKAVFAELESSIQTLLDLEAEKHWLKTTDRPYLTIEAMVNEIEDRKSKIFKSAKELIQL